MNTLTFRPKPAVLAVATLTVALVGSWLWFLSAPAQVPMSQAQLNALAAQAGQSGQPGAKHGQDGKHKDEAVKNAIRQHALAIQKPWLAYLANPSARPGGAVTLDWTIAADGQATQVTVARSDFDNAAFNDGVRDAVATIVFPPPPGGQPYDVTHRLYFKQEPGSSGRPD